jgi:hypothetical protein
LNDSHRLPNHAPWGAPRSNEGEGQTGGKLPSGRPKEAVEAPLASKEQIPTLNEGSGKGHLVLVMTSVVMAGHGDMQNRDGYRNRR